MTATEPRAALCDKFTKADGKRGKPARDSLCAVCDTVWTEHFNEKVLERGNRKPVLHPEHIRVIPEPKRKRRPRAVVAAVVRKVAEFIDPADADPYVEVEPYVEPYVEPEPEVIDRMGCGHPITELQTVDGVESCQQCIKAIAFWEKMREWSINREMERTGKTREEAEAQYEWECTDW